MSQVEAEAQYWAARQAREQNEAERLARRRKVLPWRIAAAVIVLTFVVFIAANAIAEKRENDERVDGLYCTLSGISLYDTAPKSGKTCYEIIYGD